ncbi:hypothetical protein DND132_1951 [Pseudodesulfovibrio mercurii]|uniref:Uncharacterized protein n=1 Tax=Pseudodesulfovibrio mercurii TaxID=641491 RepID=F0JGW7_9BACT|nr:hypothetical protein [Pseudodesulfovibrio mercurii]EGB15157.1 hypothetical protein DND132_1951 [Pseudodesulfovibrio mercurii]
MPVGFSTTVRNALLDRIVELIDADEAAGALNFYDGTQPSNGGATTNLLCTAPLAYPCAEATAAAASLSLTAPAAVLPSTAGTATWARLTTNAGTFIADLSVGETGSGANIIIGDADLATSVAVDIQSITLTAGNAGVV